MIRKTIKNKNKAGFVLLFAVTLSAIVLSMALGVANIAFNEIRFGTNARDTNDAFFAADVGAEYALFHDSSYPASASTPDHILGLGSAGKSCASITVDKRNVAETSIISNGYNIADNFCNPVKNSVVRQIRVTYSN